MPSPGTWIATTVVGCVTSLWLYKENRSLRAELEAAKTAAPKTEVAAAPVPEPAPKPPQLHFAPSTPIPMIPTGPSDQTRLDKRASKQQEMSSMFGRQDGETDEQYRGRVIPILAAVLALPRKHITEMRKLAEQKANVTPDQDEQIEAALKPVYQNVLNVANAAVANGTISPYERNIAAWLEFGGTLGPILEDANNQINGILTTDQAKAMYDTGFEWGEYLGLETPWEQLTPPPPPRH